MRRKGEKGGVAGTKGGERRRMKVEEEGEGGRMEEEDGRGGKQRKE